MDPAKYTLSQDEMARLDNNFSYHEPIADQPARYETIRAGGKALARLMLENCPRSRELSMALTHLEDAVINANAAIARNERVEN